MDNEKLRKNLLFNVTYQILILFLPLVTSSYLSRIIGADGIGQYSYTYSIALYFSYFILLGLNTYGNRTIASLNGDRKKISDAFCELYFMQGICFVVVIVIYIIYSAFFAKYQILAFIQLLFLVSSLFDINWYFFGREMFEKTVIRNAVVKIVTTVCIFSLVRNRSDVYKYAFIMCLGYLGSQLTLWPAVLRYIEFHKVSVNNIFKHFKSNLLMFLPVIAISIYKVMDKIMLGAMSTASQVGFYENAEKIVNVPVAVITAFGTVMLPRVTSLVAEKKDQEVYKYRDIVMHLVTAFSCAAAFGVIYISDALTIWMYGNDFRMTGTVMKYLAITVIFLGCGNVLRTQYLIPYKKDKVYISSAFIGAIVNFIINSVLIPKYASVGAAIGTICAEFAVAAYQFIKVKDEIPLKQYLVDIGYLSFAGSAMCFILSRVIHNTSALTIYILKLVICGVIIFLVFMLPYSIIRTRKWRKN